MTYDEQVAATDPHLEDLQELCEVKKLSVRNVPIEAFQDASTTLQSLEKEVGFLKSYDVCTFTDFYIRFMLYLRKQAPM